jgi:hypothetical protein
VLPKIWSSTVANPLFYFLFKKKNSSLFCHSVFYSLISVSLSSTHIKQRTHLLLQELAAERESLHQTQNQPLLQISKPHSWSQSLQIFFPIKHSIFMKFTCNSFWVVFLLYWVLVLVVLRLSWSWNFSVFVLGLSRSWNLRVFVLGLLTENYASCVWIAAIVCSLQGFDLSFLTRCLNCSHRFSQFFAI